MVIRRLFASRTRRGLGESRFPADYAVPAEACLRPLPPNVALGKHGPEGDVRAPVETRARPCERGATG